MSLNTNKEAISEITRLRIVLGGMLACLAMLVVVLWRVQIVHASVHQQNLDQQSMRRVRLPASRGRIFDRNGICLADNRPSYCIAIHFEELRQAGSWSNTVDRVDGVVDNLAETLRIERQVTRKDIARLNRRRPLPFIAWRDIDSRVLATWMENDVVLPGVDLYVEPVRFYPRGALASHVLGYVGSANPKTFNKEERYHFFLPDMAGRDGIEESMNAVLTGQAGWDLVRVDASGFRFRHEDSLSEDQRRKEPRAGLDVVLTVDSRIQKLAEKELEGERGAIVILDPRNGDVLAMASRPTFNPNLFGTGLTGKAWRRLRNAKGHPLFNRAITGTFPPGSTFKPLVAIAAVENHRASAGTVYACNGGFTLGNVTFRCWRRSGHGRVAMRKSIEQSCNTYFCQLGLRCGYDRVYHMADAVGFGKITGIDLRNESHGVLPNEEWERRRNSRERWGKGDTCNVSIGQGYLTATPLQMTLFTAAIANGGTVYRPRLVRSVGMETVRPGEGLSEQRPALFDNMHAEPSEVMRRLEWRKDTLAIVRGGMVDVVQAKKGTGKRARIDTVAMAGKTGTAEYGPRDARKKHAWMIVYAPAEAPRYALAIVIQDGVSGGTTAAPRVKRIMKGIFDIEGGGDGA